MPDYEHFDRLVSGISPEERKNLMDKLKGQFMLFQEPLYTAEPETEIPVTIDEQYSRLPWYYRLGYFLLALFRGKPPVKLYEERQVTLLGQIIEEQSPGIYNYRKNKLLPVFYSLLENLKTSSRFFYSALNAGFNRDKGSFYSFLGSLEMPDVHAQLGTVLDPASAEEKNPGAQESEIRQIMLKSIDDALKGITEESRTAMYFNARSLFCLKELSFFPFDRILKAFSFDVALDGYSCSVSSIRDMLVSLNNILFSLKDNPPTALLESLFVFLLQEKSGESGFDLNREIRVLLSNAEEALAGIRDFNKRAPLTKIIRCAGRNTPVPPREISGGEDWYFMYREYWKNQAENKFSGYIRERRRRELLNSFRTFLRGANLKALGNIASESNPDGIPVRKAFSLSFLLTFYSAVFLPDLNKILKILLIDADFSKKENRIEFNEHYNNLIRLDEMIEKFVSRIAVSGEYGKRYVQARQEMSSLPVRRKKIQIVVDEAAEEAAEILDGARRSCRGMVSILGGILGRDPKGKYQPLSNLAKLSDRSGEFINGINDVIQKFEKTLEILDDIDMLE